MNDLLLTPTQAISALLEGKVGVMPTDTVYGLVARAEDPQAVARMYALKDRQHKPGTVIAASLEQLRSLGVAASDLDTVKHWWPNPVTAVLPLAEKSYLHQNVGSLAVRVVADAATKQTLVTTGPLLTSSANLPGRVVASTVEEAYAYFGTRVDFYVDSGPIVDHLPSTIIRPSPNGVEILRTGSIAIDPRFTSPQ